MVDIRRTTVGSVGAGPVAAYTLDTGDGLAVTVWTYGARLVDVLVPDRHGRVGNVVVRLPDLTAYAEPADTSYHGAVLGRFCRSIASGRFVLDGEVHQLDCNAGDHHVHGGSLGFDRQVWTAEAGRDGDTLAVHLRLRSPDGDQGYPGELSATVSYALHPRGELVFECQASTTAPTIVGLTNHAFWNLAGGGIVDRHQLTINATRSVEMDAAFIPVPGPPAGIAGTPLDFTAGRPIGASRLDNFYVLDDPPVAAELYEPTTGRTLRIGTDQPGLGVYSGDGLTTPRAGLTLQTGAWPDAPNRPDFPAARLQPGDLYRHRTSYRFGLRDPASPTAR